MHSRYSELEQNGGNKTHEKRVHCGVSNPNAIANYVQSMLVKRNDFKSTRPRFFFLSLCEPSWEREKNIAINYSIFHSHARRPTCAVVGFYDSLCCRKFLCNCYNNHQNWSCRQEKNKTPDRVSGGEDFREELVAAERDENVELVVVSEESAGQIRPCVRSIDQQIQCEGSKAAGSVGGLRLNRRASVAVKGEQQEGQGRVQDRLLLHQLVAVPREARKVLARRHPG